MIVDSIRNTDLNTPQATHDALDLKSDISFFNSMMPPPSQPGTTSPAHSQNLLSEATNTLNSITKRMARSLRAVGNTDKFEEARKYPHQLSNAVLLQHMLTKCVGKTAQGIDKISNLQ
nr:EscI/YscI/HrpB family type III secretion system inner rod protein [uncultured Pseudomonas sp.]